MSDEKAERWASQFTCPIHGRRTYDTVLTTKCCGEVLKKGGFCNETLQRNAPQFGESPSQDVRD